MEEILRQIRLAAAEQQHQMNRLLNAIEALDLEDEFTDVLAPMFRAIISQLQFSAEQNAKSADEYEALA